MRLMLLVNIVVVFYVSILIVACGGGTHSKKNELKLPEIFNDGMVLQRDRPIPIWGTAKEGQNIHVSFNSQIFSTVAAKDGRWLLMLPAMSAGGGTYELIIDADVRIKIKDILIGDVWIAGGQSNMEWAMNWGVANGEAEMDNANYSDIRFFRVPYAYSATPLNDVKFSSWMKGTSENLKNQQFSAVSWYFSKQNYLNKNVPVGVIDTSVRSTNAFEWVSLTSLITLPSYADAAKDILSNSDFWNNYFRKNPKEITTALPGLLYNAMIAPLEGFGVRGFIWYQGESNVGDNNYDSLFAKLITEWRVGWSNKNNYVEELPFLFVQLASYSTQESEPSESPWANLRNAQKKALSIPNTGMAVTIDIGDTSSMHPANKKDVGERLWLAARKVAFDEDITSSGPLATGVEFHVDHALVNYDYVDQGLAIHGNILLGFELAGEDGIFRNATAAIDGNHVIVKTEGSNAPKSIRYGWANNSPCNLYNTAGLPAVPFQWPDK